MLACLARRAGGHADGCGMQRGNTRRMQEENGALLCALPARRAERAARVPRGPLAPALLQPARAQTLARHTPLPLVRYVVHVVLCLCDNAAAVRRVILLVRLYE